MKNLFSYLATTYYRSRFFIVKKALKLRFIILLLIFCGSVFTSTASLFIFTHNTYATTAALQTYGTFNFAAYGFPAPDNPNPKLQTEQYQVFSSLWRNYMSPMAQKTGQALGIDPGMIGGWTLHEQIQSTFFDNCNDNNYDPNTVCKPGLAWQVGYGVIVMDNLGYLEEAMTAMHPGETITQVGNNVVAASKTRDTKYPLSDSYRFPDGITISEMINNKNDDTTRIRLGILMKDDAIGTYLVGKVIKGYMALGTGMAAKFESWVPSYYAPQDVSNSFDAAYKAGISSITNYGQSSRESELYAIYTETTFYDSDATECITPSSSQTVVNDSVYQSGLQPPYILEQFAIHVLKALAQKLGKSESSTVTPEHVLALITFMYGEGGDINNGWMFNPLNTGIYIPELIDGEPRGNGTQGFISFDAGVEATALTMLGGYQARLAVTLSDPNSNAAQFMETLTYYDRYPGNLFWAEASKPPNQDTYYQKRLELVNIVRGDYENIASTSIGTPELEWRINLHDTSKLQMTIGGGNAYFAVDSCTPTSVATNSAVAGNIVQTALNFVWHDKKPSGVRVNKADATEAYQLAVPQYNPSYASKSDDPGIWSDCGFFVGTVVAATGIDLDYPGLDTAAQKVYVLSNPDKWQTFALTTNDTSLLLPGDILIHATPDQGHTMIWTGAFTGTDSQIYNTVEARWHSVVPQAQTFYPQPDWYVARYKGS